jgi:Skp family chaperone for outer membrane proteins
VKKLILCSVAIAVAAGVFLSTRDSHGQAAAKPLAHQVGLIDMAFVFKNYDKFKRQTEALQAEIKVKDDQAKTKVETMKTLKEKLDSGSLQTGSPEYLKVEGELIALNTGLETFRKQAQLEFLRREADIYKSVYSEVQKAVTKYADFHKYTLIMRFNRDGLDKADNPQEIIQSMNRQVVYFRGEDDCTDVILQYLNDQYAKSSETASPGAGTRQTPPRTATQPGGNQPN